MKITLKLLEKLNACSESRIAFEELNVKSLDVKECFNLLLKQKKYNWLNWLISRLLKRMDKIRYAIYAAEQVLYIFEEKYPNDNRPRNAIMAAKKYLKNPNKKNKAAVAAAAAAAYAAAAEYAYAYAYAAADAAEYAAAAAAAAADAAADADADADAAAYAVAEKIKLKIIKYGIKLYLKR